MPERPAAMPATCVPCSEPSGSNGVRMRALPPGGANARATMILPFVPERMPFGKPGRVLVGGARERRPRDVDAVVDDADAHAVARGGDAAVQPAPERGSSHDRGHAVRLDDSVGLSVIRHGRPHAQHPRHVREPAQLVARERHDERVHDGAQAAAHLQPRSHAPQAELGSVLIACQRREREAGRHAPEVHVPARVAQLVQRRLSETAGARSSTTTSARAEAAYAGAAAKASNAPSATNRARAGSLTSSGYPEPVISDTGAQLRLCCNR